MAYRATSTAILRTKTGCLTCRKRRKKCNEALKPLRCERCIKSNRACVWPTPDDLLDNRNRRGLRVSKSPSPASSVESLDATTRLAVASKEKAITELLPFFVCREIGFKWDLFNLMTFRSDLEVECFRHYVNDFQPLLLLSTSHQGFKSQLVPEVAGMLLQFDGLRDAILACGASHKHRLTGSSHMREAGIKYYSRAVSGVNRALNRINWERDDNNDALLLTVILLYIHGVFNIETNKDVIKHVTGATQLMKLRDSLSQGPSMPRPIHRIIWESVLYQIFRQTANRPFAVDFEPDVGFWTLAEVAMQSLTFPDASPADNSPVIGFPWALQKLIIEIVQLCKSSAKAEPFALQRLSAQLQYWESTILAEDHCSSEEPWSMRTAPERSRMFHQHSTSLHVLAASLLLGWVVNSQEVASSDHPLPPMSDVWQVRRGLEILRCPQAREGWSRCYLGSWPTLIFGYVVDKPDDIALIRNDLKQRYQKLCSGEELLFLEELEVIWRSRATVA